GAGPGNFQPFRRRRHPANPCVFPANLLKREGNVPTLLAEMDVTAAIDPEQFIRAVQPLLERQDVNGLLSLLHSRWSCDQLRTLLHSNHLDAKKVALLAIGLVGTPRTVPELAVELRHADRMVNEMAEHALWSVWFRSGTPQANHELARGAQAIGRR